MFKSKSETENGSMKNPIGKTGLLFGLSAENIAETLRKNLFPNERAEVEESEHLAVLGHLKNAIRSALLQKDSHFAQYLKDNEILGKKSKISENIEMLLKDLNVIQSYVNFEVKENKISSEESHIFVFKALNILKNQKVLELRELNFYKFNNIVRNISCVSNDKYNNRLRITEVKSEINLMPVWQQKLVDANDLYKKGKEVIKMHKGKEGSDLQAFSFFSQSKKVYKNLKNNEEINIDNESMQVIDKRLEKLGEEGKYAPTKLSTLCK